MCRRNQPILFILLACAATWLTACGSTMGDQCSPRTCSGCCSPSGTCVGGTEVTACGIGGSLCTTCAAFNVCTAGFCSPIASTGGGFASTGGGSGSTGGGSGTTGGGTSATGGGTSATGGGTSATGGGTSATGGGTVSTGGGASEPHCAGTTIFCGTSCVDPLSDIDHCNGCGRHCGNGEVCDRGTCHVLPTDCTSAGASCGPGYFCEPVSRHCQPGCRLATDCPSGATCVQPVCTCPAEQHSCGQSCVSSTSTDSCGTSCVRCPSPANSTVSCAGTCGFTCLPGYQQFGDVCDLNECLSNNGGCHPNALCTNTVGSRTCTCNAGYSGDGLSCAEINECLTNNGGCSPNATCTNTPGSRTCACKSGFTGDGVTCTDIDECATNNGGCSANALCTNTAGGRTCACVNGATGDGITCTAALPVGSHATIYNLNTRGYWFTAPAAFTLKSLRVATEASSAGDSQTIEVVKFAGTIATQPSTSSFTSLGRFVHQPGGTAWVPCSIAIAKGDIIGIVGVRGLSDGGVAHSYGTANTYSSTILGQPVVLKRLGVNVDLEDAGTYGLWTESNNPYGRIEALYSE